jgi:hypothetical protein
LFWHRSGRITTQYSRAELMSLIEAAKNPFGAKVFSPMCPEQTLAEIARQERFELPPTWFEVMYTDLHIIQ